MGNGPPWAARYHLQVYYAQVDMVDEETGNVLSQVPPPRRRCTFSPGETTQHVLFDLLLAVAQARGGDLCREMAGKTLPRIRAELGPERYLAPGIFVQLAHLDHLCHMFQIKKSVLP
jgi:hypothetical protein